MKFTTFTRLTLAIMLVVSVFLAVICFYNYTVTEELSIINANWQNLVSSANQYQTGTSNLINQAQLYVATGNVSYYNNYVNEINMTDSRGKAKEAMQSADISEVGFELITKLATVSDALVALDKTAISYVQEGDLTAAAAVLYGAEYQSTRSQLDNLFQQLNAEIKATADAKFGSQYDASMVIAVLMYICTAVVVVTMISSAVYNIQKISKPLNIISDALHKLGNGVISGNLNIPANDTEVGKLVKSYNSISESINMLLSGFERIRHRVVIGDINHRAREGLLNGCFNEICVSLNTIMNAMSQHLDNVAIPVLIVDKKFNTLYANRTARAVAGINEDKIIGCPCFSYMFADDCNTDRCAVANSMKKGDVCKSSTKAYPNGLDLSIEYFGVPIYDENGEIAACMEYIIDLTAIAKEREKSAQSLAYQEKEVDKVIVQLERLNEGQLSLSYEPEPVIEGFEELHNNFMRIANSLNTCAENIRLYISEVTGILASFTKRDFTGRIEKGFVGDFAELRRAVNAIADNMNHMFNDITRSTLSVGDAADRTNDASQSLSSGASEQAKSVSEIGNIIADVREQSETNTENAKRARVLSGVSKSDAEAGNAEINTMVEAMESITEASQEINSVIKVIDDIAFQTNILALNASIEANRAGERGRGFAVVAEEVRNLAAHSQEAVSQTRRMIQKMLERVKEGSSIAYNTQEALTKIVHSVSDTEQLVETIAEASRTQVEAITKIETGMRDISGITIVTSDTATQSAASAATLAREAQRLSNLVATIKLRENEE